MKLLAQLAAARRTFAERVVGDCLNGFEGVRTRGADVRVGGHGDSSNQIRDAGLDAGTQHAGTQPRRVLSLRHGGPIGRVLVMTSVGQPAGGPYGGRVETAGRPSDLSLAAAVAVGGVLGALARWSLVEVMPWHPPDVPVATLTANLIGCVLIGVLLTWWTEGTPPAWWVRPFAAVGFVGGFTTFSAFAVEGVRLVDGGAAGVAAAYTVASVVLGLLLVHVAGYGTRKVMFANRGGGR